MFELRLSDCLLYPLPEFGLDNIIVFVLDACGCYNALLMVYLYPRAVFVRPVASGRGVKVAPANTELFILLLLKAVLYILVIEFRSIF